LYLRETQQNYATTDIWADTLLNKSAHASDSRTTTHALFAQELTKIANSSGVLTTCIESRLPYRDAGNDQPTRKRADMMTLTGCGVIPNAQRNFSEDTRLIMDVTIGHVFDTHHNFKPNTLLSQIPNASNMPNIINDSDWLSHQLLPTLSDNLDQILFNFFGISLITK